MSPEITLDQMGRWNGHRRKAFGCLSEGMVCLPYTLVSTSKSSPETEVKE